MCTVTDRAELPEGFCPQPLTAQACRHVFYVRVVALSTQFIRQAWGTITLFCLSECLRTATSQMSRELLARAYLMATQEPDILVASGNPKYTAHGFDAELSPIFFDKDIHHFRRFAKYVAVFWRMASSSSRSASCRLRRAISTDIS